MTRLSATLPILFLFTTNLGVSQITHKERAALRYTEFHLSKVTLYHNKKAIPACKLFAHNLNLYMDALKQKTQVVDIRNQPISLTKLKDEMEKSYKKCLKPFEKSCKALKDLGKHIKDLPE